VGAGVDFGVDVDVDRELTTLRAVLMLEDLADSVFMVGPLDNAQEMAFWQVTILKDKRFSGLNHPACHHWLHLGWGKLR